MNILPSLYILLIKVSLKWLILKRYGICWEKVINLVAEAAIVGDVEDVFGVVEGGPEAIGPQLDVIPLLQWDPLGMLSHQRQLRQQPGLQVAQLLGFVQAEEGGPAIVEEPRGERRCDPSHGGDRPPNRGNLRHGPDLTPSAPYARGSLRGRDDGRRNRASGCQWMLRSSP